ncbi:hypothetical protein [Pseudomonas sp. LRF_L74]|uniref:hypothetical protein n=1 Tax=Pseudomonas sp. LRF_L74 TaxID=3369422 RepID=UPI003F5F4483
MPPGMRIGLRRAALSLMALTAVTGAFFAWQNFYPVTAASGWSYDVAYRNVHKAASLVQQADGVLVSQELQDGRGSILHIAPDGTRQLVVEGLSKPDGMIPAQGGVAFSQESGNSPVSLFRQGKVYPLFEANNAQGLWADADYLYAIEDRKGDGRLLRYRWSDASLTVLRDNLSETEALTRCSDGRMLYTEKAKGTVRQVSSDGLDPVLLQGLKNPTFLLCDERGLWITEDSTHRARLLLVDPGGQRHTVLSFLKAPQGIVATGNGTYLIAEGGRDRVLALRAVQ